MPCGWQPQQKQKIYLGDTLCTQQSFGPQLFHSISPGHSSGREIPFRDQSGCSISLSDNSCRRHRPCFASKHFPHQRNARSRSSGSLKQHQRRPRRPQMCHEDNRCIFGKVSTEKSKILQGICDKLEDLCHQSKTLLGTLSTLPGLLSTTRDHIPRKT